MAFLGHEFCWAAWQRPGTWPVQITGPKSACMHDLNTSKWQMVRDLAQVWLQDRSSNAGEAKGLEWGMAWLVFKITFPLKTFTSSVSLLLPTCYWKIASCKRGGKPFDARSVCISHTLTRTYTKKYISSSISETANSTGRHLRPQSIFQFPSSHAN